MPRATISRDGARLVFASNFALQVLQGAPAEYSDAYLLTVPGTAGGGPIFAAGFESGDLGEWSGAVP
jgi:hypothetical protein